MAKGKKKTTLWVVLAAVILAIFALGKLGGSEPGEFTLALSAAQDHEVIVNFTVKGSAVNGTDYVLIKGTKKFKPGKTSKPIRIYPQGDLGGAVERARGLSAAELKAGKRMGMRVHGRAGEPCPVCGDTVRQVSFRDSALDYCPTCQTGGKPLADRRLSRLLK